MCWTLRCVLYTGYAAWQIKRIRTYIRRGMVYSRPLRGRRIPTAAQTKTYIAYTYLTLAFSFQPCVCSFSPLIPSTCSFSPLPQHLLFDPLRRRKRGCTLSPFSVSLSLSAMLFLFVFVSSYYINIIFN